MGDNQYQSIEKTVEPNKKYHSVPVIARDDTLPVDLGAGLLESRFIPKVEEDDLYYGIYEGSENILISVDADFESKDSLSTRTGECDN